jgi:hypothetical protein
MSQELNSNELKDFKIILNIFILFAYRKLIIKLFFLLNKIMLILIIIFQVVNVAMAKGERERLCQLGRKRGRKEKKK